MIGLLEQLALIPGVSGDEGAVAARIAEEIKGHCDECVTDPLGNLLVYKKGKKRAKNRVMLAAHMDEVGFIVTAIGEDGLLRFDTVGGIDARVIAGKPVLVGKNRLPGVVGLKPVHLLESEEKDKIPKVDELYLDIGANSREQAAAAVRLGDRAIFDSEFVRFGEGLIKGRALDDRAGCAALVEMIRGELEYDAWFAFTVQEETGTSGAKTAAFTQDPDYAIVVETTTAGDMGGAPEERQVCRLGRGPVVSFMDKGTIYDPELFGLALAVAAREGVPAQVKEGVFGGNDSRSIQCARGGVRTIALSIPCRYLHSPSCVLHGGDAENTLRLTRALAAELAAR